MNKPIDQDILLLDKILSLPRIEGGEHCKACGGVCCKHAAGTYIPSDIEKKYPAPSLHDGVVLALKSGVVMVDWWKHYTKNENDMVEYDPIYFVRPRVNKDPSGKQFNGAWGGICCHLKETGCELSIEQRPYFCSILKSGSSTKDCYMPLPNNNCNYWSAIAWRKSGVDFERMKGLKI